MSSAGEESCCSSSSNDPGSTTASTIADSKSETSTSSDCNLECNDVADTSTNGSSCTGSTRKTRPFSAPVSESTANSAIVPVIPCPKTRASSEPSEDSSIPTLRFPQKLWRIVNECRSGAIAWGPGGYTVFVDEHGFTAEFLLCDEPLFKTRIFSSFVRQLNLYGFRKVTTSRGRQHNGTGPSCEFLHEHFRRGRLDLLSRVCRKTCNKKSNRMKKRQPGKGAMSEPCVDPVTGLTKLETCQIALTQALEQATRQYREEISKIQRENQNIGRDEEKSQVKTETEHKIRIVIGDMVQIVNVEDLPIIDASIIPIITNTDDCKYENQWRQIFTITSEGFTIPTPQQCEKLESS